MFEENKNLKSHIKDTSSSLVSYETIVTNFGSYTKANKLISALYMVTDIMDKDEPLRNKLRSLGAEIISDIHSSYKGQTIYNQINIKVSEVLSFMEIASSVGIISEMNSSILIKEFIELRKSAIELSIKKEENWLEEFIKEDVKKETKVYDMRTINFGQKNVSNGHTNSSSQKSTRIGVQTGDTLLRALSDRIPVLSNKNKENNINKNSFQNEHSDVLKNKRREGIILVIKDKMKANQNFDGATITDIKSNGHEVLAACGEKTLQRELVSMVSLGILKKTGEKRWSKYSLK